MKAESEPEKTDHGEDFYFSDTAEISSNASETVDRESTTETEHDTNCIEIQPSVSMDPTDHDTQITCKTKPDSSADKRNRKLPSCPKLNE